MLTKMGVTLFAWFVFVVVMLVCLAYIIRWWAPDIGNILIMTSVGVILMAVILVLAKFFLF